MSKICPNCGSNNIQFKREKISSASKSNGGSIKLTKHITTGNHNRKLIYTYRTIGMCKDCGCTWSNDTSKNMSVWRLLLLLCFWPISLSVWFWKTDKIHLSQKIRGIVLVVIWSILLLFSLLSNSNEPNAEIETSAKIETVDTNIQTKDSINGLQEKIESEKGLIFQSYVENDVTGNCRLARYSSDDSLETFALDYYNAFFKADNEVHTVINFNKNVTGCITKISDNTLDVCLYDYVDNEEHNAKEMFSGTFLEEYHINISDGTIEKIQ